MPRSTREVFDSHLEALETGNFEQLAGDYAGDAVLVTVDASFIGKDTILKDFFQATLSQFPGIKFGFEKINVEGDVCLLRWSAEASNASAHGVTTFIIQDGLIQRQSEWFEVTPKQG